MNIIKNTPLYRYVLILIATTLVITASLFLLNMRVSANYSDHMIAVHRFYNLETGTHFYTADDNEAANVKTKMSSIYRYENIGYHAYSTAAADRVAVHRFYNFRNGTHFYTASQNEATNVNNTLYGTYRYEGVSYAATAARYFKNCTDANDAGFYAIKRGQPGYGSHLDRDNDGIACDITSQNYTGGSPMVRAQATVTKIIDGDTIDVNINGVSERLRLIGIDTPETVDPYSSIQCYGIEAGNFAKITLSDKLVILDPDYSQGNTDAYGRLLRYVTLPDSTNFNELMIRQGYAREYTYRSAYSYQSLFKNAQLEAQQYARGLWSSSTCSGGI